MVFTHQDKVNEDDPVDDALAAEIERCAATIGEKAEASLAAFSSGVAGPNTSADAAVDIQATVVRSFLEGKTETVQKRFMEGLDVVLKQAWKQPSVAPPPVAEAKPPAEVSAEEASVGVNAPRSPQQGHP